jgi:hypothetical protein
VPGNWLWLVPGNWLWLVPGNWLWLVPGNWLWLDPRKTMFLFPNQITTPKHMLNEPKQVLIFMSTTGILSFYGSLPRFQLEDGSDQTALRIDFKFADNVDHTQI